MKTKIICSLFVLVTTLFLTACDNVPYYPEPAGSDSCWGGGCEFKRTPQDFPTK